MTLNGWHRLLIVITAAWALAVTGLATLEYQASQGEIGDGFFTCWEPPGGPPATRYWNRDCGLFPRTRIATDLSSLFEDIPPHTRYLNGTRFLAILLGPPAFIGLCIVTICWIVSGFSSNSPRRDSEPKAPRRTASSGRPELPPHSHAETWLHRLPRRWARNATIGGGTLAVGSVVPFLSKGDGTFIIFMLVGAGSMTLFVAGAGYLCGLWARYSLRGPFALNPASALNRITSKWLTGAILVAALIFASGTVFGWRSITLRFDAITSYRDWGYLTGFFGSWMLYGYLTALASKMGLRRALNADLKSAFARAGQASISQGMPPQVEYSIA